MNTHNDDDLIQARIPYNDSETGESLELLFCKKTDTSFIVPAQHVRELIALRKSVMPSCRHRYAYHNYRPQQKWSYFVCGMVVGAAAIILITILKTLG